MPLTAGQAIQHIHHALGADMADEISHMDVVNMAGRWLCSAHPWAWLSRRAALIDVEAGLPFLRLPRDVGAVLAVRRVAAAGIGLDLVGLNPVQQSAIYGATGLPWSGSVARRQMPVQNLLQYSAAFNQTDAWNYAYGVGVVTANAAVSPYTGELVVCSATDESSDTISELSQTIPPRLLTDAKKYSAAVVMRPDPVTSTSPPKSAIQLGSYSPDSGGRKTLLEIQWGQTPWQDEPTATVIDTNDGGGVALDPEPEGEGFWRFAISGYEHQADVNYGRMLLGIQPARAAWADASGTDDLAQTGKVDIARAWCNEGMLPFDYTLTTSEVIVPKRLEPVIELDVVPTTTTTEAFSLLYTGYWAEAEDDGDDLTLPSEGWLDSLYLQAVRAFAKGWEESGQGEIEQRLALVMAGPLWRAAVGHDGSYQRTSGQLKNTAYDAAGWRSSSGPRFPVAFNNITPT